MDTTPIIELLTAAEETEYRARTMQDQKSKFTPCDHEYGGDHCNECCQAGECESMRNAAQSEIDSLFETAWRDYHEVEKLIRQDSENSDSNEGQVLLARVLMNIHIHPNSGFARDSEALWEAQYHWLHLYYRTGNPDYLEQARLCDGIRHASVEKI